MPALPSSTLEAPESSMLRSLRKLTSMLQGSTHKLVGLKQHCQTFFQQHALQQQSLLALQQATEQAQQQLRLATRKTEAQLTSQAQQARQRYQQAEERLERERLQRHELFVMLCQQFLALTEGQSRAETIQRSSRLLGSLQLQIPEQGAVSYRLEQKFKPFYKATLALRLLDQLLEQQLVSHPWILEKQQQRLPYGDKEAELCPFRTDVQVPLLMAVFLQDLGQLHPLAQQLMETSPGKLDVMRRFTDEERSQFIDYSQHAAIDFLQHGMAMARYRGNSKVERDALFKREQQKLQLTVELLKQSLVPGQGIGNLLRLPQVYASAVLPGRPRFHYEALPKVALILKNGARAGQYDEQMVDALLRMTGIFPQGFGIAFISKESNGQINERYELAIVNSLYPPNPETPLCRVVTRNQAYRSVGYNCSISIDHNLYFKPARDRFSVIPPERLQEILRKLSADFDPRQVRNMLPRCWHPAEFFTDPKKQNLWNRLDVVAN